MPPPPRPLQLRPDYFRDGTVDVEPAKPNEGPVRRLAVTANAFVERPAEGIDTTSDIISYAAKKYGRMPAVGWRDVIKIHEEQKEIKKVVDGKEVTQTKTWKFFELSDYKYLDYLELEDVISQAGRGLASLGISSHHVFNIYASTGLNWQIISQGCALISTTIATAYDTLGEAGLEHSLNEPESIGLFTDADLLPTVIKVLPRTPSVKFVVYHGSPKTSTILQLQSIRDGEVKAIHIDDLLKLGKDVDLSTIQDRRPTKDVVACIMYTSGSTGNPKGVCLSHGNIISSVASVFFMLDPHICPGDKYLAYLPLAHVLEYVVEIAALFRGLTTGFARSKTLMDNSVRNCQGDLATFQPNIMVGVPAVWEAMKKGIISKVQESGRFGQKAFSGALALKSANIHVLDRVADRLVFASTRNVVGGQMRFALSGSAALNEDTQDFLNKSVGPLVQAYGMTETSGMCSVLPPEIYRLGSVGLPAPSVEIKFIDIPDAGYSSKNDPPTGEVCVRGPSVTKGYFKRPDLNEDEAIFTKDGWFRTGDVGQWNEDGTLTLIDRIKNLIKLQHGEYIALEKLESIYKACQLISNICVYASAEAKQPIGIIVPHEHNIKQALSSSSSSSSSPSSSSSSNANSSLQDLCEDKTVKNMILEECNSLGKHNGLRPVELLCDVILTAEEWTPENGLLTAAQKLQRGKVANVFKDKIEMVYKDQK